MDENEILKILQESISGDKAKFELIYLKRVLSNVIFIVFLLSAYAYVVYSILISGIHSFDFKYWGVIYIVLLAVDTLCLITALYDIFVKKRIKILSVVTLCIVLLISVLVEILEGILTSSAWYIIAGIITVINCVLLLISLKHAIEKKFRFVIFSMVMIIVTIVLTLFSSLGIISLSYGEYRIDKNLGENSYVYQVDKYNKASLERINFTLFDYLKSDANFTVNIPSAIGKNNEIKVNSIYSYAFEDISVNKLIIDNHGRFYFNKSLVWVEDVYLPNDITTNILLSALPKNKIYVHKNRLDEYRENEYSIREVFSPIVDNDEVYVTFNFTAPKDSDIFTSIPSQILKLDQNGVAKFTMPYQEHLTADGWRIEKDGKIYKFYLSLENSHLIPGENLTTESLVVNGEWKEIHTIKGDLSADGGSEVVLFEMEDESGTYILNSNYENACKPGYYVKNWFANKQLTGEPILTVTDTSKNYILYPKWELKAPEFVSIITSNSDEVVEERDNIEQQVAINIEYKYYSYEIIVDSFHALKDQFVIEHKWYKDNVFVSDSILSLTNVSDSGTYKIEAKITDADGNTATTSLNVDFTITPKTVTVVAQDKEKVYGEGEVELTYLVNGLLNNDELVGSLEREVGENAGTYAINQGTLNVPNANYVIDYTAGNYVIDKAEAQINVSGVQTVYTYNGQMQTVNSGAVLNHSETELQYTNNTFTTVEEGNGLEVVIIANETDNYYSTQTTVMITVNKAEYDVGGICMQEVQIYEYDGQPHYAVVSGSLPVGFDGIQVTVQYSGSAINVMDGDVVTTATFLTESTNYNAPLQSMSATVRITPKTITVVAEDKEKVYGEEDVALTYLVNGLLNNDELVGSLEREVGENAGTYAINQGTLNVPNANYVIDYTAGNYVIDKAEAQINVSGVQTVYTYNGQMQTVNSGAVLNHSETELQYTNNTFTTVEEGNGLEVVIIANETDNYYSAQTTVVITVNKAVVTIPTAKTDLIYNGEEQVGVEGNSLYSVENGKGTEAKEYIAIVTLNDQLNYQWECEFDGIVNWNILSN